MTNDSRLIVVLGLAFLSRIALPLAALAVTWPRPPLVREPDSEGYARLAEELVATGRFAQQGRPEIERTPGYVVCLLPGVLAGHVDTVTIAVQCAIGCLTVYLTYVLSLAVFQRRDVALAGAALCAFEPLSALYAGKLLTETTFTCAVTALTLSFARYLNRGAVIPAAGVAVSPAAGCGWSDLLGAAVLAAIAIYIRPIALYLPGVLSLLLLVVLWMRKTNRLILVAQVVTFVAIATGLPACWIVRNQIVAGFDKFSAMGDVNLYFWQAAGVEAARQGRPLAEVQQEWGYLDAGEFFKRHPESRGWTAAQRGVFLRHEAWRIFRESPGTALAVHLAGIRSTLFDPGTQAFRDYFRRNELPAEPRPPQTGEWAQFRRALATKPFVVLLHGALQIAAVAYLVLALVGVLAQGNWRHLPVVLLVVTIGYLLLLSGGPAGYHRFRLPLVPALSVLAGAGWFALRDWRPRQRAHATTAGEIKSSIPSGR